MSERNNFLAIGTKETAGVSSEFQFEVTANSPEEALEKAKKHENSKEGKLRAVYTDWRYNYKGAVSGDLVWKHNRGFL